MFQGTMVPAILRENLTTNLNEVTDDVPASANSLPDVTPVNQVTLNLNLPENENEPAEMEDLPENEPMGKERPT